MNDRERLDQLLSEQDYMIIAVTLANGTPWAVPVRIRTRDGIASFEWDSHIETEHSKALVLSPSMAISIYQAKDNGQIGFYAKGMGELVEEEKPGMGHYRFVTQAAWINDETFKKRELSL